jgi:hypothetical protein
VQEYVAANLDDLLAVLELEGRQAAEEVDAKARQLLNAIGQRQQVEGRVPAAAGTDPQTSAR